MKVVINKCYGGFSLSPRAVSELARLDGKTAYFFKSEFKGARLTTTLTPITEDEAANVWTFHAFDIPNFEYTDNEEWGKHSLESRPDDRANPKLVAVVEMLGAAANGQHAELEIVEIPDGVDFQVEDYDGREWISEKHRTWN